MSPLIDWTLTLRSVGHQLLAELRIDGHLIEQRMFTLDEVICEDVLVLLVDRHRPWLAGVRAS